MTILHRYIGVLLLTILYTHTGVDAELGISCGTSADCDIATEECIDTTCACIANHAAITTRCVRSCQDPDPIDNMDSVNIVPDESTLTFTAVYTCLPGFNHDGTDPLLCDDQGNWVGQLPVCIPDPCSQNPCPTVEGTQVECTADISGTGHVCICPDGLKGPDCTTTDTLIVCDKRNKRILFELNPDEQNRTLCLPKRDLNESSICFPGEDGETVKYSFDPTGYDISVDDRDDFRYCLTYLEPPTEPSLCVNITAHETHDYNYRPWLNTTVEICFVFNKRPRIYEIPVDDLRFNVVDMLDAVNVPINATALEESQTNTLSIRVIPEDRISFISLDGDNLNIQNPKSTLTDWNNDIYNSPTVVEITATDNGVPSMSDVRNFTIVYKYFEFNCTSDKDLYLVHLIPLPVDITNIGTMVCTVNGQTANDATFSINSAPGPVVLSADGVIQYDPTVTDNRGTFSVTVEGRVERVGFNLTSDVTFTLLADDLQPTCTESGNTAAFSEKAELDTCSDVLYTCSDLGDVTKTCTDLSDRFYITCDVTTSNDIDVRVCLNASIVFSGDTTETVTTTVFNEFGSVTLSPVVSITNVNDPPAFSETSPVELTVPEDTSVGDVLKVLIVDDPDMGPDPPLDNLSVTLTDLDILTDALPFEVNMSFGNSVSLVLSDILNGAVRSSYNMSIEVQDSAGLKDSVNVVVLVDDVNEAPVCDPISINAHATVRDIVGSTVTQLTCSDNDFEPSFKSLTYTIQESADAVYFTIDTLSGVITLASTLPSDVDVLSINVDVADGGGLVTTVAVEVNVTSDYPPTCDTEKVVKDVPETSPTDCFGVTIPCVDAVDSTGQLQFIVSSGNGTDQFSILQTTINNQAWSICPINDLKGQVGIYSFVGVVRSVYGDTDLTVNINVEDVNEPPTCADNNISVTVPVNQPISSVITTLQCVDVDVNSLFNVLTYTITDGNTDGYFAIDVNGEVSVASSMISITSSTTVSFNIVVSDGGGLYVTIPVEVTINANFPPECNNNEITQTKSETTAADVSFNIDNVCVDPVNGESLSYSILNGNGTSLFNINPDLSTNNQLYVYTVAALQGNYGTWELNVAVATSYGQTTVKIIITVTDQNEAPSFINLPYTASVAESAVINTVIFRVSATDPDSGVFGQLSFHSTDIDNSNQFSLNRDTGVITVISSLDAETSTTYTLAVQVKDEGSPQLSDSTTVTVNIQDVNDNKPVCTQTSAITTLPLLSPVGTVVYTAICTDADITDIYRQMVFSTTSTLFEVNSNGTVTLNGTLPRDETSHVISIKVEDADKPGFEDFTSYIQVTVNIDTNAPPVCASTSITLDDITEMETVGLCVGTEVLCEDPTGVEVTLVDQQGNASSLFEIRKDTKATSLVLNACIINSLKDKFNTYELIGVVSNGLGTTTIHWIITVNNVNEAPEFSIGSYSLDLPETTVNSDIPVLVITVTDPDNGKGNTNFELSASSIKATVTNDADYNGELSGAFLFVPGTTSFYAITSNFNATIRDLYIFNVTATDNGGLSNSAQVVINITDINEQPQCNPLSIQADTNILAEVGTEVVRVFCYDTDFYPQNTALDFYMSSLDSEQYFNVTSDGAIIVGKPLPRTLLYGTGRSTFRVVTSDGGSPALTATVSVDITVDNKIPAECSPVVTPPDVWVQNKCTEITMDCTDPTKEGTAHLQYYPAGNYTNGFELRSNTNGVLTLCYKHTYSSVYEIVIDVDNELKVARFTELIVVSYSQAIPLFNQTKYTITVNENIAANERVLTVNATLSIPSIGDLVYTVIEALSMPDWNTYIALDSNTGVISTIQPLKSLANTVITLKIEAEDTGSKLKSSVPVEITVEDINEAPSCGVTSTNLNNLAVNVDIGTKIVLFKCTDPDVKETFNTLTYTLSDETITPYFQLVGTPPDSIAVKSPLAVSREEYVVTLTVRDNGTPPLSVIKEFKVTVSVLPPAVNVVLVSKTHHSIQIEFSYPRDDFYDVTQYFKVKALTVNEELVHESAELTSMGQIYNITGLQNETAYNIVVEAITDVGTRRSPFKIFVTREIPVISYITISFVVPGVPYTSNLRDVDSLLYYSNRQIIAKSLGFVLNTTKGYERIHRMTFRPWNSILVDTVLALNQSADAISTMNTLEQAVQSGWLDELKVDSTYFVGSYGAGYIAIPEIRQSPPTEILDGAVVSLECKIETIGYLATDTFTYWWTFRGIEIQPTDQSRYGITTTTDPDLNENKLSVLKIDPIETSNEGQYGCYVRDNKQQEQKKLYNVVVISRPIVVVEPKSMAVEDGATVIVRCKLVLSPGVFQRFVWHRNGEPFVNASNEVLTENGKSSNITISGIQQSITLGCAGVNQAGASDRVLSTISVIPPDITDDEMCPDDIARDVSWPKSTPGAVVRLNCNDKYTGERYRECDDTGVWKLPVYNCVNNQIQDIADQVNQLKDGASTVTLDAVLQDMNTQTENTELFEGDLRTSLDTLQTVVDITSATDKDEVVAETENILEISSHLIDEMNKLSWMSLIEEKKEGAIDIPKVVEEYLDKKLVNLLDGDEDMYSVKNILVQVGAIKRTTYNFPDKSKQLPEWVETSGTSLTIPGDAFKDLTTVHYASSFYREISPILVKKLKVDGMVEDITNKYDINSDIISFQVKEQINRLDTPAKITFKHFSSNYSYPLCTYWDFTESAFSTDGIRLVSTNDEYTVCESDHFTNFALLMSPGRTPAADVMALSIISAVGCGISILCLVVTIILYIIVWRYVKSDRAILLLNLCVALIISYIVFLAGVDRVDNTTLCTVISALLHYFYLVVFFLMLAYGIEIAVCVVYVFVTRSRIRWLLPLAWGIPLLIVGISLGVTQLDGYGNDRFCWLSTEDGVLWAFVAPALLIILINFAIVVIVLRQMFKSSVMMTKSDKEKAVTGVRSLCVLLPILGLTWVFGVFSVNESLVVFQYIFAICNSLQGFLIFLFHCILNKQLMQALKQRHEKKKSMASIENSFKNQQSTGSSAAFATNDSKSTQLKNNDSATTETSNPFLQADRQMKELVAKNKTGGNINETNNKVDKDVRNKPVDIDDVKISNILRESEVMGGTAGISSILQETPRDENPPVHKSKPASQRYDYIDPYGMNRVTYDNSAHGSGSPKHSAHSDRSRDRKRELEREREEERLKQIEYEKRDKQERDRKEREKREREKIERDRERQERERKDREKDKHKNKNVIKIGYGSDTYLGGDRRRDHSHERRGPQRPRGPSRADDDYEKEAKKQADSLQKKKEKKKSSLKERSGPYEYSYESTYLGGNSRHASLENMNSQQYLYSPYAQMPGMGGYQTGRPTHQQQHWDQYRYPRDPRDPYGRDYW